MSDRRVMVVQVGARRNYIYARQLENAGLLHTLVTDGAWPDGRNTLGKRLASRASPRLAGAIARRSIGGIPAERISASFAPNIVEFLKSFMHEEHVFDLVDETLAWPNKSRRLDGVSVVVNYYGNGGSLLSYAKRRGAKIVTDFCTTSRYLEIEHEERMRWPGWDTIPLTSRAAMDALRRRTRKLIAISDLYLCPSPIVAEHLADVPGFDEARVRILPYGASGMALRAPSPTPGRILFAGSSRLLKGLPYLAEAASLLKRRLPSAVIVVAGAASKSVVTRPETRDIEFLGMLDRERMAEEFARADVYCHPSLVEGSSTAIYEALANGLPVVTTKSSGSVVHDGDEGFIVPERDAEAIAAKLVQIVGDRQLREAMSAAAFATAQRYSDDACGRAFIDIVREALDS